MKNIENQSRNDGTGDPLKRHYNRTFKNLVLGFLFMLVGFIIIGNRTDIISDNLFHIIISWQALLIGLGVLQLASNKNSLGGIILILIGTIFILPEIVPISIQYRHLTFPAVLIVVGLFIIFRPILSKGSGSHEKFHRDFEKGKMNYSDDYINEKSVFSGINVNVVSKQFKGGKFEAIFGGGKINLLNAELSKEGKNILELDLVFGGVELIVPRDWNVVIKMNNIFGGFSEKSHVVLNDIDSSKELILVGKAVFGGGEIKRY